jgi:chromosome segregation ATPase
MSFFHFMLGLSVVFILIILIVIFFVPSSDRYRRKKGKEKGLSNQKDWQQKAQLLERKVGNLKHENEQWLVKCQKKDDQIAVYKEGIRKLKDKLKQEKEWFGKEQRIVDKTLREHETLKKDFTKSQEEANKEHAIKIRLEGENKELKHTNKSLNDQRRLLDVENMQLKERVNELRKEIAHLKKDNIELTRKHEDTEWVAKADYLRVDKLLRERDKELSRVRRELDKELKKNNE